MKLIVAIIQDEHTNKVIRALMDNKIRTTRLSSTGGFLKSGNTTLLIGAEEADIDKVVEIIKKQCSSTKVVEDGNEVKVGAANLFIMDIDQYVKL
ncbi:cyclic-di-AMP receptor [Wansuia hejianensis]|uniref:Cyclic-di-AMP receptor n=1 Tax=Wansuia hejianensis TaxID=2763667 RepID=A0A926EXD3_9FIRM|nr:cyclic-di-AMP receptor [Wansuia hejianensis]MBC8590240.1 cyclic-di-AMP receptor [Wansuia hejianensis]